MTTPDPRLVPDELLDPPVRHIPVGLSSSSVAPAKVAPCFAAAAEHGYDGVEIMVWIDKESQDASHINRYVAQCDMPVLSLHAPTLLVSRGIMGNDHWEKIDRTMELADQVGAPVVVAHPPFTWQGDYAKEFVHGVAERNGRRGVRIAVENMFPWYMLTSKGERQFQVYRGGWDPVPMPYEHVTLDVSHAGTSRSDVLAMARALGPRLAHVHLTDSRGSFKDEHLVPGDGDQPVDQFLRHLRGTRYGGSVVVEINTRGRKAKKRAKMLARALEVARRQLGLPDHAPAQPAPGASGRPVTDGDPVTDGGAVGEAGDTSAPVGVAGPTPAPRQRTWPPAQPHGHGPGPGPATPTPPRADR